MNDVSGDWRCALDLMSELVSYRYSKYVCVVFVGMNVVLTCSRM